MRAPRPLALVRGVANVKAIRRKFYSRNTLMPAIRDNFLPRNKPTIVILLLSEVKIFADWPFLDFRG